ncbi:MAG TPA: BamA/TamA family outer membrane protein, partial [Acidobacteriota bacterium]|nr:BamA/TamA family outer membrane protein [Acidobacteriota bacterium]
PDGRSVCFVSNKNGIYNLYLLDSSRAEPYPITDALSGCFAPTWSPDGKSIAFTAFFRGGFDVFLMTEIRPRVADGDELELTAFMRRTTRPDSSALVTPGDVLLEERSHRIFEEDLEFTSYVRKADSPIEHRPLGVVDTVAVADSTAAADSVDATPVIGTRVTDTLETTEGTVPDFRPPDTPPADSTTLAVTPQSDTTPFEVHTYKRKFSPDLVTGGLGYDTFYGLQGQSFFVISDFLGDHQFFIVTDLVNTIDQSNIQVYYAYRPRRIDYGIGLFHSKYYYIDYDDRLFSDRTYGMLANASRPFSKFTRVQFDAYMIFINRVFSDANDEGIFEDRFARVGLGSLSLVHDDISWGMTGPVNGRRYRLSAEYAPGGLSEGVSYQAVALDFRQYFRLGRRYSLGLRVGGGVSGGNSAKRFYLGGVENWIGSKIGDINVYDVEGLYFSQVITPLRGFNYYDIVGNKYFIANAEFRFPFIDRLAMRFPLPIVLSQIAGALYFDMGSAWQGDQFHGATSDGGFHLKDLKASFGYGLRANLGFVVFRFDQAWRTDLRNVLGHPKSYFSLGADF